MARRWGRRARTVGVTVVRRNRWVRINPEPVRARQLFPAPRVQRLLPGWTYKN